MRISRSAVLSAFDSLSLNEQNALIRRLRAIVTTPSTVGNPSAVAHHPHRHRLTQAARHCGPVMQCFLPLLLCSVPLLILI